MVEVFKTDVTDQHQATLLVDQIHQFFNEYRANFDLEDCGHILRIACASGHIDHDFLINLLKDFKFYAEILHDEVITLFNSDVSNLLENVKMISENLQDNI
ncbi:MAG: hypothetical protein ACOH2A_03840 [Sphingobacteriaceae bacterium]